MANKKFTDSNLKLLLEKQELLLKEFLEFSQRQFAESDQVALDELLTQKDFCFEELRKVDTLIEKWYAQFDRALKAEEKKLDGNIQLLLEKILHSEKEFEKVVGRQKNEVSLQIAQLSSQMLYRKEPIQQRAKIKNMLT